MYTTLKNRCVDRGLERIMKVKCSPLTRLQGAHNKVGEGGKPLILFFIIIIFNWQAPPRQQLELSPAPPHVSVIDLHLPDPVEEVRCAQAQ